MNAFSKVRRLAFSIWQLSRSPLDFEIPKVQAHRGLFDPPQVPDEGPQASIILDRRRRENTLPQILHAVQQGAPMIEIDVRPSWDGVPFVCHDESVLLENGSRLRLLSSRANQLQEAGIPSLREILQSDGIPPFINIELKSTPRSWSRVGYFEKEVCDTVRLSLRDFPARKYLFSSFDPSVLVALRLLAPEIPRAFLFGEEADAHSPDPLLALPLTGAHLLHLQDSLLNREEWLSAIAEFEIPFAVWTVNDPARARRLFNLGAVSVISDLNLASIL